MQYNGYMEVSINRRTQNTPRYTKILIIVKKTERSSVPTADPRQLLMPVNMTMKKPMNPVQEEKRSTAPPELPRQALLPHAAFSSSSAPRADGSSETTTSAHLVALGHGGKCHGEWLVTTMLLLARFSHSCNFFVETSSRQPVKNLTAMSRLF